MTTDSRPTLGAIRHQRVIERFRETGIVTGRCRVDGPGTGQGAWCHTHGWAGAIQDCRIAREGAGVYGNSDCPHQLIAAWVERQHAYNAEAVE